MFPGKIHHQENQQDRLEENLDHLIDGRPDKGGGIVGDKNLQARGKNSLISFILALMLSAVSRAWRRPPAGWPAWHGFAVE